jgi:ketosteroid isomerase-like protein
MDGRVRFAVQARRAVLSLWLCLLLAPAGGAQTVTSGAEGEVRDTDARRIDAMVAGDTAALAPLLADELTYTHSNALVESKDAFLASIASKTIQYRSLKPSDVKVQLYGETAVITGRVEIQVTLRGQDIALPARFTAVYVRQGGAWRLAAWQTTRIPEEKP